MTPGVISNEPSGVPCVSPPNGGFPPVVTPGVTLGVSPVLTAGDLCGDPCPPPPLKGAMSPVVTQGVTPVVTSVPPPHQYRLKYPIG